MKIKQFIIPRRTPSAEQGNQDRSFEVPPQTEAERAEEEGKRGGSKSDLNVGYAAALLHRCIAASSVYAPFSSNGSETAARLALRRGLSFGALFISR